VTRRRERLDCHFAPKPNIARAIYLSHPACTQR
jgi:hypothetical protein